MAGFKGAARGVRGRTGVDRGGAPGATVWPGCRVSLGNDQLSSLSGIVTSVLMSRLYDTAWSDPEETRPAIGEHPG